MAYRLYFWFQGVDESRPGGPWWYRDFHIEKERDKFLDDVVPFLHVFRKLDGPFLPVHDPFKPGDIEPPEE